VDKSPQVSGDRELNFVFKDQDDILRTRYFGGFKLKYYVFAMTFEAMFAGAGTSVDDRAGTEDDCAQVGMTTTSCDSTDQAVAQQTYTITLGLDF